MTEHEKLKQNYLTLSKLYDELNDKYESLLVKHTEEHKLNDELIEINRKVAEASNKTAETFLKYESENSRMRKILKHGIFVEYNKDPKTIEFVPVLGDILKFTAKQQKPSRMMYTFTFDQIQQWLNDLNDLMQGKNIHKVNPEDIK